MWGRYYFPLSPFERVLEAKPLRAGGWDVKRKFKIKVKQKKGLLRPSPKHS
jgi:hypothetical protein